MKKKHAKKIIANDAAKIAGYAAVIEEVAEAVLEEEKHRKAFPPYRVGLALNTVVSRALAAE